MKKVFYLAVVLTLNFSFFGCAGKTKIKMQEIAQPLVQTKQGVSVVVLGFGTAKHWSQMEIAIANMADEPVEIKPHDIYLKNEKDYYLLPYSDYQVEEKIEKRTGKYVNPLTIGAVGAALTAIILPSKSDRDIALKAAGVLAGGAIAKELAERQGAKQDIEVKDDFFLKKQSIPPGLKFGGLVYYPPVKKATGMKAIVNIKGENIPFEINF